MTMVCFLPQTSRSNDLNRLEELTKKVIYNKAGYILHYAD